MLDTAAASGADKGQRAEGMFPLEARGLTFTSGGRTLIDDVTISIDGRNRTVIVGENGAGKSLLLRLLHGLITPTCGEVLWGGLPADDTVARKQALVFQRPTLLRRSAADNLDFVLGHLDPVERRETIQLLLSLARLESRAGTPARLLSGGEQQRLALARALALEPAILFLDEPAAALDPASTLALEAMISRAHEGGTKIVLVTHNIGQARRIADEIVFMHDGRVCEVSSRDRFFAGPASAAAAAYLEGRLFTRARPA